MAEGLDSYQKAAVETAALRVRVLAGAGSGKTRVLAGRVKELLARKVPPESILAVTFSKKAADELRFRTGNTVDARTIHSLGYRLLQTGLFPGRNIADDRTRKRILRRAMIELKSQQKFSAVLQALQQWKGDGCVDETPKPFRNEIIRYQALLSDSRLFDFDDLINVPTQRMLMDPEKLAKFKGKWQHLLIDEVQDTDRRQWALFECLTAEDTHLFVVGDISQSIYGWRGARPMDLFGEVEQKLGPFEEYRLPRNYRSRPDVIHLANRVVAGKMGAVMLEATKEPGLEVVAIQHPHGGEPLTVGRWVQGLGAPWSDTAILARTNARLAEYEAILGAAGIPYAVTGGYSFYERQEVQDVLAYLSAARGLELDVEALERVYSKPTRYLGKAWLKELQELGGWAAWTDQRGHMGFSRGYMNRGSTEFFRDLEGVRGCRNAKEAVDYVIDGPIGYRAWMLGEDVDMADELRDENLTSLSEQAKGKSIDDLLALARECKRRRHDDDGLEFRDRVTLSTVHKAKGLEWPNVAVVGLDEAVWPHANAEDIEEERRILYVALTRAEERLLVACRIPSSFYREVVQHAADAGVSVSWRGEGGGEQAGPEAGRGGDGADPHDPDVATVRGGGDLLGDAGDSSPSRALR